MKPITLIVILAGLAPLAHPFVQRLSAEINTVAFDSFEAYDDTVTRIENGQSSSQSSLTVLGGGATFTAATESGPQNLIFIMQPDKGESYPLGGYGFASVRSGVQHAGFVIPDSVAVQVTFAAPVFGFGGYFQFSDLGRLRARFYDADGTLIPPSSDSEIIERTNGSRFFLGWYSNSVPIKTILFSSVDGGAHSHAVDDIMIFDSVPEPGTMAALGLGAAALLRRRKR